MAACSPLPVLPEYICRQHVRLPGTPGLQIPLDEAPPPSRATGSLQWPPSGEDGASPDTAELNDTQVSSICETTVPAVGGGSAHGGVRLSRRHVPSPVAFPVIAAPPVSSSAYFSASAVGVIAPAFFLYPGLWPSLTLQTRQDTIPRESGPVHAAAHALHEAEEKEEAKIVVGVHRCGVLGARDAVASSPAEAPFSAREVRREANCVAQLQSRMAEAERRAKEVAARSKRKTDAKEAVLHAMAFAETGAQPALQRPVVPAGSL